MNHPEILIRTRQSAHLTANLHSSDLSEVEDECFLTFGAWTLSGHFKGVWRMESGEQRIDTSAAYMVILPEHRAEEACDMLAEGTDAPTFSKRIFGPQGELSRLGQTQKDRERILKSSLFQWLKAKYDELRLRGAAQFEPDLKRASGRLTVLVPRSLHAASMEEAASEDVPYRS